METEILTKYEEVQNALAAVDDVLDMSRIESGRICTSTPRMWCMRTSSQISCGSIRCC